jgi:uridylate kinase
MRDKEGFCLPDIKYRRILLKISGEALAGDAHRGLDFDVINAVCRVIRTCKEMGVQIGIVIGGGNFWRGVKDGADKMQRSHADSMGMLATVMNSIAVADALEKHGVDARVLTAVEMNKFAEYFTRDAADRYLNEGKVVIFAAGTGNPYFSTDTGAVLRGVEIEADAVLLAKNVDGIYSADPNTDPTAVKFDELTYDEVLARHLKATDTTAMTLAMDNHMSLVCFALKDPENIIRVVCGEKIGTIVKED